MVEVVRHFFAAVWLINSIAAQKNSSRSHKM